MPRDIPITKEEVSQKGGSCETGPVGSFCNTGGNPAVGQPSFSPIVMVGVNPEPGDLGPITKSDLKNIQGRYFTKEDNYAVILDKDLLRRET